uniref:Uncharacterized protein n=1 Tax=Bicosoecida sp. CB-2014 TaxID=1486930 RepID=A0A7S1G933_9STRA|mmetsp:Transcript_20390/g.72113  ORF Transcript_20390/g.72113 Transcript_20390/m.72113 type:complete len:402 (+) Transcript_20390:135-1340(+)|eukprot:CAMPEP_0203827964 /NCGR_PEP_ID=MMETSP0115-20131106/60206_1 /ASSEMBLY_ACC=CAM_ASM_000227 /TAXON_ID=33651 /ORGANISM="Bicosoecid sp, Strain ms1" /LENGTH=401 /DNA_ID=CAMNT_0050737023 /DNA_START=184 /DNA_END=1389 /DNA_ORIENTATION=+
MAVSRALAGPPPKPSPAPVETPFGKGRVREARDDKVSIVDLDSGATAYVANERITKPKPPRRLLPEGTKVATPYGDGVVQGSASEGAVYTVALVSKRAGGESKAVVPAASCEVRHKVPAWEHARDAVASKDEGNKQFRAKDYAAAARAYQRCIMILNRYTDMSALDKDERETAMTTLLNAYLNMAQCFRSLKHPVEAIKFCTAAIELDGRNKTGQLPKAYLRRGQAYYEDKEYRKAANDLAMAGKLVKDAPASGGGKASKNLKKDILTWHGKAVTAAKAAKKRESKRWGGFLEKAGPDGLSDPAEDDAASNGGPASSPARSIDSAGPAASPARAAGAAPAKEPAGIDGDLVEELGEVGVAGEGGRAAHAVGEADSSSGLVVAGLALLGAAVVIGMMWWRRR